MKKPYIRAESRLFVINLDERIAASSPDHYVETIGKIKVTDGLYYADDTTALVRIPPGSSDEEYERDFILWVSQNRADLYFNCFKWT